MFNCCQFSMTSNTAIMMSQSPLIYLFIVIIFTLACTAVILNPIRSYFMYIFIPFILLLVFIGYVRKYLLYTLGHVFGDAIISAMHSVCLYTLSVIHIHTRTQFYVVYPLYHYIYIWQFSSVVLFTLFVCVARFLFLALLLLHFTCHSFSTF